MIVLEAEFVAMLQTTVDVEHALNHAHALLPSEVPSIDVENLPFFNKLRRKNHIIEQHSFVFDILGVFEAHLEDCVAFADDLSLVVEGRTDDTVAKVLQAFNFVAAALDQVCCLESKRVGFSCFYDGPNVPQLVTHIFSVFFSGAKEADVTTRLVPFTLSFRKLCLISVSLAHGLEQAFFVNEGE